MAIVTPIYIVAVGPKASADAGHFHYGNRAPLQVASRFLSLPPCSLRFDARTVSSYPRFPASPRNFRFSGVVSRSSKREDRSSYFLRLFRLSPVFGEASAADDSFLSSGPAACSRICSFNFFFISAGVGLATWVAMVQV
jgi:hypothetical protein